MADVEQCGGVCWRWQQLQPDGSLAFSCDCGGDGCPHDPRLSVRVACRDRAARAIDLQRSVPRG